MASRNSIKLHIYIYMYIYIYIQCKHHIVQTMFIGKFKKKRKRKTKIGHKHFLLFGLWIGNEVSVSLLVANRNLGLEN